jgi:hypothetical protein
MSWLLCIISGDVRRFSLILVSSVDVMSPRSRSGEGESLNDPPILF